MEGRTFSSLSFPPDLDDASKEAIYDQISGERACIRN